MNYRLVSKYLGHFTLAIAVLMLPSMGWAVYFREWAALRSFAGAAVLAAAIGGALVLAGWHAPRQLYQREALALVSFGWLGIAFIGALPYVMDGGLKPIDAFFESMSGFTTTGSTVIADIEREDLSLLFWRSFTHWLGGMGIVLLFLAVLPYLGAGGKQLFKSESSGPDPRGLTPRIKDTAAVLFKIYLSMTIIETGALMFAEMSFYDALCHTFGTLATGGFSTRQESIAAFHSLPVEIIIIVFMLLASMNFGLYFDILRGDWKAPFQNTEWRAFMILFVVATGLVTLNLLGLQGRADVGTPPPTPDYTPGHALRAASFQVASIMTTTGFATEDFDVWPYFSRMLFLLLMCVGGCAGSTAGGLKIVRIVMLCKLVYWRIENTFRPKTIRPIRINGVVVDEDIQKAVYGFFVLYAGVFVFGSLLMSCLGLPFQTAVSSIAATLNGVGPGLEYVGAVRDFTGVPDAGKLFLCLCMVMGRLELFSILVLFVPSFWKHS